MSTPQPAQPAPAQVRMAYVPAIRCVGFSKPCANEFIQAKGATRCDACQRAMARRRAVRA